MTPEGRKPDVPLRAFVVLAVLSVGYGLTSFAYLVWAVAVVI